MTNYVKKKSPVDDLTGFGVGRVQREGVVTWSVTLWQDTEVENQLLIKPIFSGNALWTKTHKQYQKGTINYLTHIGRNSIR